MPHNVSLITTIAAALGFGLIFGFIAVRLLRLPALVGYLRRRHHHWPGHARLRRRRPISPTAARRNRRDAADVRRRPALLARRPAFGQTHRTARCTRADRRRHGHGLGPRVVAGLDRSRPASYSVSHCRSRARSCCCARSKSRGLLESVEWPHRRRLARRRRSRDGARPGAAAGTRRSRRQCRYSPAQPRRRGRASGSRWPLTLGEGRRVRRAHASWADASCFRGCSGRSHAPVRANSSRSA